MQYPACNRPAHHIRPLQKSRMFASCNDTTIVCLIVWATPYAGILADCKCKRQCDGRAWPMGLASQQYTCTLWAHSRCAEISARLQASLAHGYLLANSKHVHCGLTFAVLRSQHVCRPGILSFKEWTQQQMMHLRAMRPRREDLTDTSYRQTTQVQSLSSCICLP